MRLNRIGTVRDRFLEMLGGLIKAAVSIRFDTARQPSFSAQFLGRHMPISADFAVMRGRCVMHYPSVRYQAKMSSFISDRHPLRTLFTELVQTRLIGTAQLNDVAAAKYIAGVLVDFCHVENLYKVRNSKGKRLEDVGEMLIASNPILEGRSFIYEREVRKHIGDYTLFLAGIFPEYVARIQREKRRLDSLVDYLKAGKESYSVVAAFDQFEFRHQAPLFRRLADRFELCVFGLNLVKQDLERIQSTPYEQMRKALE
jgi:hypothetical protein